LARAKNELGEHVEARRICVETIEHIDRDFTALNLGVSVELCLAEAGLGETEQANRRLEELLERHAAWRNPVTMGALHRAGAQIAWLAQDVDAFDRHAAEVERWFRPTRNPALIAQCDGLRGIRRGTISGGWTAVAAGRPNDSVLQSLLECADGDKRKELALQLVAEELGVSDAWLFSVADDGPRLIGRLGGSAPSDELLDEVTTALDRCDDDGETKSIDATVQITHSARPPAPAQQYRTFPLTIQRGGDLVVIGALAVPFTANQPTVSSLVQKVADHLFQAGDITVNTADM
jgi:hypothetical protein